VQVTSDPHAPTARHSRSALSMVRDIAIAIVLAVLGTAEVWVPLNSRSGHGSRVLSTILVFVVCLPLALRRRYPLGVAVWLMLAFPLSHVFGHTYVLFYGQFIPMAVSLYTVARLGRGRAPFYGAALAALVLLTGTLLVPEQRGAGDIVFNWGVLTLVWVAGFGLRTYERRARANLQRAIDIEIAAVSATSAALIEERTRIARELHDIVAHSVSVMVVQAGAAEQMVEDDPAYVREALRTIRTTGASALSEMRKVVAMLREGDETGSRSPQPGLDGLPFLLAAARENGLDALLRIDGTPRTLPAGLDLAAYRIVQEALSNVRRHSSASKVEVCLRYADDSVRIEVSDNGVGSVAQTPGHGLIGMRERAALYGGRLETESNAGFTVRAILPLAA
jgi:signal transduction histidine kinase